MDAREIFYAEKFDAADLTGNLYGENPGVVLIPDFVKQQVLEALLNEIHSNKSLFIKAKEVYGRAEQRFFMHYFGFTETGSDSSEEFPLVTGFSHAYNQLSRSLVKAAGLSQQRVSSTGIHIYWKGDKDGLSPHRDSSFAQLISVFILGGYSPFYVADNHELKKNKMILEAKAGSLVLMRGPRNPLERKLTKDHNTDPRPIHCIGPVQEERTVVLLRHVDESLEVK